MRIEGSKLRLDEPGREDGLLTSLHLPAGATSGGLLLPSDDGLVFLVFADEELHVGDEVSIPPGRRFTVTSVRSASLGERPVTALGIRSR